MLKQRNFKLFILVVFIAMLVIGCRDGEDADRDTVSVQFSTSAGQPADSIRAEQLELLAPATGTLFQSLTAGQTGIAFQNTLSVENQRNFTFNGAGVASGDYDSDGLIDLFLVTEEGQSKLFRNLGNFQFEDVTEQVGLGENSDPEGFSIGAYFADIDNDRDLDLFLTNWNTPDLLYRNNGDGTFTDITEIAGVGYEGGSTTATFADYDRDGDLDFFVATYRPADFASEFGTPDLEIVDGEIVIPEDYQSQIELVETDDGLSVRQLGEPDLLYRNNGDGTFTEVAEESGIVGGYWGLSASFHEVDNDGWPDLYVTNDFWSPDTFYRNNGDGTFSLVHENAVQHTPMFAMGMDFADINNDGWTDYFVGDMLSRDATLRLTQHGLMDTTLPPDGTAAQVMRNGLYLNNGDGSFSEISWMADVAASEWTWTTKFADLDLDGFVDLLITNGMIGDLMDSDVLADLNLPQFQNAPAYFPEYPPLVTSNLAFRNTGDLSFEDVSSDWGLDTAAIGHGATLADLDNDGDLDAVLSYMNQQVGIYRNGAVNNRIVVKLSGRGSNSQGIGARVTIVMQDESIQTRLMSSSGGYLSGHAPEVVFGLGNESLVSSIRIDWPSGHTQRFNNVDGEPLLTNRYYTIAEPEGEASLQPPRFPGPRNPFFARWPLEGGLSVPHIEADFDDPDYEGYDDFKEQALLPRRLSVLGPGVAWDDVNNDGFDDLYIAGAQGQNGIYYTNNGDGSFTPITSTGVDFLEELAPLWFYNGQKSTPGLALSYSRYEERGAPFASLLNQEDGEPEVIALSELDSAGALASADVDGDGDLDLFVGGRGVPGLWPLPASSRLLRNDDGQLVEATNEMAPDFVILGMATGAMWLDVDSDQDSDLLIATELGPIQFFRNEEGVLRLATPETGLNEWSGLWTGLTAGDFNEDGHLDFAAANFGLNTRYHASAEEPAVVYVGDLDDNPEDVEIVEAEYVDGVLRPMRERGMIGAEMPFVLEQYDTFLAYSEATLAEIYGARLDEMVRFEATTLEHMVFINDGTGVFTASPLPKLAQSTTGYGITTADFDNDGHDDIYLVGNFSYADPEFRQFTGGVSYWLHGAGDGTFDVIASDVSGLFVPVEGRGTAVSDFNRDGWVDVVVGVNDGYPLLFANRGQSLVDACSIQVRLDGGLTNPRGVGARLTVTLPDGSTTMREVQAGSSYFSQNSAEQLFGLGEAETADLEIVWPDGVVTVLEDLVCGPLLVEK